jgi:CRISPR/Cas system CSM-associated protein Csm3 (group 7 of RAMP superfamily)
MTFINPYNFVVLEDPVDRKSGHPGFLMLGEQCFSGKFNCELTAKRDLITLGKQVGTIQNAPDRKLHEFCKNGDNRAIIRGTSIKGMIRSVYEALHNGCMWKALISRSTEDRKKDYHYSLPADFDNARCNDIHKLCPACRIFGMLSEERTCKGRLSFSDAQLLEGQALIGEQRILKVLDAPKPRHNPTYGKDGNRGDPISGRKFYYHHAEDAQWHQPNNRHAKVGVTEFARRDTKFSFSVTFENLTEPEVQSLVAALELRPGLAHKMGLGKAIGLGSCVITIKDADSIIFNKQRYRVTNNPLPRTISSFRHTNLKFPPTLVEVLRLNKPEDETNDSKIGYPIDFRNYPTGKINKRGVLGGPPNAVPGTAGHVEPFSGLPVAPMPIAFRQQSVVLERDTSANGLLSQIRSINIQDEYALQRIVSAMEDLPDSEGQKIVAIALRDKLIAAGRWNKHKLKRKIEICLAEE